MENIIKQLQADIVLALKKIYNFDCELNSISFQNTRKEFEGTHTFVVFPYTKALRLKPDQIAQGIGQFLHENTEYLASYNVVQGFLNLSFKVEVWLQAFSEIIDNEHFGQAPKQHRKVMVEYSSPNTNKPLHLGHLRTNFLGFAAANMLEAAGYDVIKSNVVNDRGIHICKSMLAYQLFGHGETPESSGIKGDHLVGDYYVKYDQTFKAQVKELVADLRSKNTDLSEEKAQEMAAKNAPILLEAKKMLQDWENAVPEVMHLWKRMNAWVYAGFEKTYQTIGVNFDRFYYESETYLSGKEVVKKGLESQHFFQKEDGSVWIDLTEEGLDQKLLLRADGTSVYITQDLGTADLKYKEYGMEKSVYVVGNEQDYHFQVLFQILKKLGRPYAEGLFHLSYGMIELPSGRMKSREGTVVDADDLVAEMKQVAAQRTAELGKIEDFDDAQQEKLYAQLALGALKYYLLKVDPKKKMIFNPEESIDFQGNTGVYLQYTHAKICAILRKAKQLDIQYRTDFKTLNSIEPLELELLSGMMLYPNLVTEAAESYSPALIANYIYDLARLYGRFYAELSIFAEPNRAKCAFRIAISAKVGQILQHGLMLLGIEAPERM